MKYIIEVETSTNIICAEKPHNREGFTAALEKIDNLRKKFIVLSAVVISERDGIVFSL